ncbi:pirin family protein [Paenibacillus hamazuiensis]|uniref:pirin family protein n=1 Tax=Paenibacillus hamazuiensis TaxID=2936508 RepID=UPI00200BCE7E|nr:pirin family protein [Paenibacillus hamazuiensis]
MIAVYPAGSRYSYDHGWLRGSFSFSFGPYYDPDNTAFGPLRVFNDDTIAAGRGFGAHPHSDMEIVSVVLRGSLKHEDSLGNVAVTSFGEIQRMSAGSGIIHTEGNPSDTEEVTLLQLWFSPERRGIAPGYEVSKYDPEQMVNRLLPVVAPNPAPGIAAIHQDLTIYLSKLESGHSLVFTQPEGRKIFVFVIEGAVQAGARERLHTRDSARITDTRSLELAALDDTFFMLIDLP